MIFSEKVNLILMRKTHPELNTTLGYRRAIACGQDTFLQPDRGLTAPDKRMLTWIWI